MSVTKIGIIGFLILVISAITLYAFTDKEKYSDSKYDHARSVNNVKNEQNYSDSVEKIDPSMSIRKIDINTFTSVSTSSNSESKVENEMEKSTSLNPVWKGSLKNESVQTIVQKFDSEIDDEDWRHFAENEIRTILYESEILSFSNVDFGVRCKSSLCQLATSSENREQNVLFLKKIFELSKLNGWQPEVTELTSSSVVLYLPCGNTRE